jgi:hypothetical protein
LHAHFRTPGFVGGLFLQSGSFFRRRFDCTRSGSGASRASRASSAGARAQGLRAAHPDDDHVRLVEENLENNRALAPRCFARGWDVRTCWNRDAHNWIVLARRAASRTCASCCCARGRERRDVELGPARVLAYGHWAGRCSCFPSELGKRWDWEDTG